MPQRFLRPGLTTSKRFNKLDWFTQTFFIRILTLADDFGRYDADPQLLRSHAFPLGDAKAKAVALQAIDRSCKQMFASDLVVFYRAPDGRDLLQVLRWYENPRAKSSKFPEFDSTCEQMFADVRKCSLPASKCSVPSSSSSPPPSTNKPAVPPTVPQGGPDSLDSSGDIGLTEAKELLNQLFGRSKRKWSYEEEQLLSEVVPIPRPEWALIDAWFRLPLDHPVFEVTKRKQELTTFLREFNGELDKMRVHASFFARSAAASKNKKEPAHWRAVLRWLYDNPVLPGSFWDLEQTIRAEYEKNLAAYLASVPPPEVESEEEPPSEQAA